MRGRALSVIGAEGTGCGPGSSSHGTDRGEGKRKKQRKTRKFSWVLFVRIGGVGTGSAGGAEAQPGLGGRRGGAGAAAEPPRPAHGKPAPALCLQAWAREEHGRTAQRGPGQRECVKKHEKTILHLAVRC